MPTQQQPVFLVTNDDGINAKGIASMVEVIKTLGKTIVISANQSFSGMSHAITVKEPLRIKDLGLKDGAHYYQTNGTPVDCVKLALHFILDRKPDFVVSGINHGSNSSISLHYSGTMGAAREGCINNIPSVGFSLLSYDSDADFCESKRVVSAIMKEVMKHGLEAGTYLNVNIPDTSRVLGIKSCRQCNGKWVEEFLEKEDPRGQKYYWLTGHYENHEPDAQDTDEYYLEKGYATVVPCTIDATDYKSLNHTKLNYAL